MMLIGKKLTPDKGIFMKSANAFSALVDIYISPSKAFNGINDAKGWSWLAFIIIVGMSAASILVFYSVVDMQFFIDEQVAIASVDQTKSVQEAIRANIEQTAPMMKWFGIGGAVVFIALLNALLGLYYMLVAKMDPESIQSYGDWFGFSVWTMMPSIINGLGALILIATAGTDQLSQTIINYASLNQIIFGFEFGDAFYTFFESINLFTFWSIALAAVGLKCWTNFSMNKAILFGALPYIVIFGIWAIIILV